jgi:hypothetical protein
LGHIAPQAARKLVEAGLATGIKLDTSIVKPTFCESCIYAKSTRKPVAKSREGERASEFAGEVHSDVWGPAPVATLKGCQYYVSFIDDKTRLTFLYLLKHKSDVFAAYKSFEAMCATQFNARIKILRSDRGGEYLSDDFVRHLRSVGTHHKLTVHDTPQHNGVAERLNRIVLERVRAMLHASGLPKFLWGEAALYAVWLKNRSLKRALPDTTPLKLATGHKPDLRNLREWGCKVWVRMETGDKLSGWVSQGRYVGVDANSKGCRVYWPTKRTVSVERNVYFNDAGHLEGEGSTSSEISIVHMPPTTPVTPTLQPTTTTTTTNPPATVQPPPYDPVPTLPAKRTRKPSQHVQDIIDGIGVTSVCRLDPKFAAGIQLPPPVEHQDEGIADEEARDRVNDEMVMVTEMSDAEALEPSSLAKAK